MAPEQRTDLINAATSTSGRQPLLEDQEIGVAAVGNANPKPAKRGANVASVAFVLLNTALGSGILGVPYAFSKAGMLGAVVLLTATSVLAISGTHLLCEVADRVGRPATFYSVSEAAAGAAAGVIIDILLAINGFGCSTSYLIVVGDVLPEVSRSFDAPHLLCNRSFWILVALAIGAPLSYLRDLSGLAVSSYLAFVCVVYISVVVGLFAMLPTYLPTTFDPCSAGPPASCRGNIEPLTSVMSSLDAMPILIFAFTTNQNAISITNELVRPTRRRILSAVCIAITLALGLYLVVGIGGYSTYGDKVESDLLKSYPEAALLPIIARVAIAFVVITCYPMQIHPARNSIMSIATKFCPQHCVRALGGESGTGLLVLATSALVGGSVALALAVTSLGMMLGIIGSICSTSVSFIIPGGCYFLLFRDNGWTGKRVLSLVMLLLGFVIAPTCLALTLLTKKDDGETLQFWI